MKKHGRARQGAAAGTSDGAVSSRLEGTPASPSARTFARTSKGGLGGFGAQWCSNTHCQPCSRRGCPCPDLSGPPCSHARASGLGTAGGCGVATLAARRLRFRSHRSVGNHGAGGVTVTRGCARVSRRWQKSARSVRCPKKWRGRGRARSEAPSRAAFRQSANRHGGSCGNAWAGALSGAPRRWKVLLVRRLVLAVHAVGRKCGVGSSRWLSLQSRPRGETRSARGSLGKRRSGRERLSGGRTAGRSG
jgi:hypothetical protein